MTTNQATPQNVVQSAQAIRRTLSLLEQLASALEYYAKMERNRPFEDGDIRGECYSNGRSNAFEAIAHNIKQAMQGECPNVMRHSFAVKMEAFDPELRDDAKAAS